MSATEKLVNILWEVRVKELEEINADLLQALEAVEWGGKDCFEDCVEVCCPACGVWKDEWGREPPTHTPDCILAKALKKARGEG